MAGSDDQMVFPLNASRSGKRVSGFLLKLTDTSLKALKSVDRSNQSLKLHLDGTGAGILQFSDSQKFRFNLGQQHGHVEIMESKGDNSFTWLSTVNQRVQILATEQSFEDTKQKTIQIAEEQNQHSAKSTKFPGQKPHRKSVAKSSANLKSSSKNSKLGYVPSHLSTNRPSSAPGAAAQAPANPELMKKSLRQRLVQLLILKPMDKTYVLERLHRDGLSETDRRCFDVVFSEVGTPYVGDSSGQKSMLKPSLHKEVDPLWPGYGPFERQLVKNKIGKKVIPAVSGVKTVSPPGKTSIVDDLIPMGQVRKKCQPTVVNRTKRPLNDSVDNSERTKNEDIIKPSEPKQRKSSSLSPPEDPTRSPQIPSLSTADIPDFTSEFPAIKSDDDYEKYAKIFNTDYPPYMECYLWLADVVREFDALGKRLEETDAGTKEHKKVEREIQSKFGYYQKEDTFQQKRQMHAQLRSKLALIKSRISEWESDHRATQPTVPMAPPVDDLTVM